MSTRRNARTAQAAALALTGTACYLARTHWIVSIILIYLACLTVWCAGRILQHEQRVRARHQQAQRAAATGQPMPVPVPCCSFWKHSDGAVHGPACTRPVGARGGLTDLDEQAFAEIIRHYNHGTAA